MAEAAIAYVAFIRFVIDVNIGVSLPIVTSCKGPTAMNTLERFDTFMNSLLMPFKPGFGVKFVGANLATMNFLEVFEMSRFFMTT